MSCNSFDAIYVVFCSSCLEEYIREKDVEKNKIKE